MTKGNGHRPDATRWAPRSWAESEAILCDEMLVRLGRWLRAAGYDTAIAQGRGNDRPLVEDARRRGRTLLTRDRKVLEVRDADACTLVLAGNGLSEWVAEITAALSIDWLRAPFSRCLLCNEPLEPPPAEALERLPEGARALAAEVTWCARCDKLYWPGSHVARMRRRLEAWRG